MKNILIIIIIIIIIIIVLFFSLKHSPKEKFRYIPHKNFTDTFIDTHTDEVKLCPRECPVFNFKKQKCVKGTVETNICKPGDFGNRPHHYRCNVFYFCINGDSVPLNCSTDTCFNNVYERCVLTSENKCTCLPSSVCSDCCEYDDDEGGDINNDEDDNEL